MKLLGIDSPEFKEYGQVLEGYELTDLMKRLEATPLTGEIVYVASEKSLEDAEIASEFRNRYFGGMPVQIGYCNGVGSKLNCLEYHRDSEVCIAATDCILLVAKQQEIKDYMIDTSLVKAFLLPAGKAAELFATTLHYAPCSVKKGEGFRVAVVLAKGTNTDKPEYEAKNCEDKLMTARNKWLLAHPDSNEAKSGAVVGLTGANIDLEEVLW